MDIDELYTISNRIHLLQRGGKSLQREVEALEQKMHSLENRRLELQDGLRNMISIRNGLQRDQVEAEHRQQRQEATRVVEEFVGYRQQMAKTTAK